ncbi:MAG: hypothetical protein ABH883_04715 [Candidatus Omnitrophota bacterium]
MLTGDKIFTDKEMTIVKTLIEEECGKAQEVMILEDNDVVEQYIDTLAGINMKLSYYL